MVAARKLNTMFSVRMRGGGPATSRVFVQPVRRLDVVIVLQNHALSATILDCGVTREGYQLVESAAQQPTSSEMPMLRRSRLRVWGSSDRYAARSADNSTNHLPGKKSSGNPPGTSMLEGPLTPHWNADFTPIKLPAIMESKGNTLRELSAMSCS